MVRLIPILHEIRYYMGCWAKQILIPVVPMAMESIHNLPVEKGK
jgi:hypothetical protein